jgi:hypothetical protein
MSERILRVDRRGIEAVRAKIRAMQFEPLTDAELAEIAELTRQARANDAIEGIYLTADEEAFFKMLDEERVPQRLRSSLINELLFGEHATAAAE